MTDPTTETKKTKLYDLVEKMPIARFYYQGKSHTHPVQRVIAVIEETDTLIKGYELRCGREVRDVVQAREHVKSYRKDKIAKFGDYIRLRCTSKTFMRDPEETTLQRESIAEYLKKGE